MNDQKVKIKEGDIKLGSDDMVYWQKILDAHERELKTLKEAMLLTEKIIEVSKNEYDKAEKEFNS